MERKPRRTRHALEPQCRRGLNSPRKGTVMRGRELLCRTCQRAQRGFTEANKGEKGPKLQERPACCPGTTVGLKSPGPETQFINIKRPEKSAEASRTKALSIADRSRICFASYEQINSVDECT